ncbi:MAG: hypothetical protein K8R92_01735 [Planctomycetes bacterium]|nr:hypothetical protein [Planctomycetota bacterium]
MQPQAPQEQALLEQLQSLPHEHLLPHEQPLPHVHGDGQVQPALQQVQLPESSATLLAGAGESSVAAVTAA